MSTESFDTSILYVTLGCAKNEVDTDRMRSLLSAAGYGEVADAQSADVVIINTCSFLASATSESIETTLQLAEEVSDGIREVPIVMCGCVPSRYGSDLPDELPEVAAFVRVDEEDGIVAVIDEVTGTVRSGTAMLPSIKRTVEGTVAYLKISDGCDRFCSFCAIPYIRGRYHSRSAASIVEEAKSLVAGGVRELVLIGQDTGIWGEDFDQTVEGPHTLAELLIELAEAVRPESVWIRVLYLQPEGMTDELIAAIRDTPEVLPYIDIPVQHCCERVLSAMNRSGSEEELEALFARLRREIPDMVIRTTYLTAFPGETEDEADAMLDFMDRARAKCPVKSMRSRRWSVPSGQSILLNRLDLPLRLRMWARLRWLSSTVSRRGRMAPSSLDTHGSRLPTATVPSTWISPMPPLAMF